MNRKANPFVSLVALVLMAVILLAVLCGCDPVEASEEEPGRERFEITYEDNLIGPVMVRIISDTETGVQYLLIGKGSGYGLTVLQPGDAEAEEVGE